MRKFPFQIVTLERISYESEVDAVTVPTEAGEITILARHTPLISNLSHGELRIKKDGEVIPMAVAHGFVEVRDDGRVIILASTAEHAREIDLGKAQEARERAEKLFHEHKHLGEEQFAKFEGALERELARIKVATKYSGRK